eukprot:17680-Heterococcus_DN1.PRE.2
MQLLLAAIACALCASVSTAFINPPLISTALTCSHTASRHYSCIVRSAAAASSSQGVQEAKSALSTALKQNGGDTKNAAVLQAVDRLVALQQPIDLSADSMWEKLDGDHLATGYNFPTGEFAHGGWSLTLGQLAFNLFEPTKLPVVVTSTVNTLAPLPQSDDDNKGSRRTYNIVNAFKVLPQEGVNASELRGEIALSGECWPDTKKPDRLTVIFTAGELRPSRGQDLTAWNAVFKPKGDAPAVPPGLRKRLKNLLLKALMGLQPPQGTDSAGVQSYTMRRAPHATAIASAAAIATVIAVSACTCTVCTCMHRHSRRATSARLAVAQQLHVHHPSWLDVLYADGQLRMTRGNKKSLVIVERIVSEEHEHSVSNLLCVAVMAVVVLAVVDSDITFISISSWHPR